MNCPNIFYGQICSKDQILASQIHVTEVTISRISRINSGTLLVK